MAKNTSPFPVMEQSGSVVRKFIGGLILVSLLVIVVRYPGDAAGWVQSLVSAAGSLVDGVVTFLRSLG